MKDGLQWDIALVEVEPQFHFGPTVKPVCMPEIGARIPVCYVLGWGLRSEYDVGGGEEGEVIIWKEGLVGRLGVIEGGKR